MKLHRHVSALALTTALAAFGAAPTLAQDVGTTVSAVELEDFAQTKAKSYDDLFGRAVLFEFFAYW